MARRRRLGGAAVLVALALLAAAGDPVPDDAPALDPETTQQLAAAAEALIRQRSAAMIRPHRDRTPPREVLGVRIAPQVARGQEHAVRQLESRDRAPVAGGPVYTRVKTRLERPRATRKGDRITLDAVEVTEMRYGGGSVEQSVPRRFLFTTDDTRIILVGEDVRHPSLRPFNDAR